MTTREKIIVGAMCLTIAYGAYDLLGSNAKKGPPAAGPQANPMEDLRKFVTEVNQKIATGKVGKDYIYMVSQANADWTKDPFIQSTLPLKQQLVAQAPEKKPAEQTGIKHTFIFSGFMQLGNTKLAVINGKEYTVGDALDVKGYYLKSVSDDKAVIGRVDSSETILLPLTESD